MAAGETIARFLKKGAVVALRGPLGAGKTCLVKGIARFLKVEEEITSPSYTIISEYEGKIEDQTILFCHIDAYRLRGADDFTALGGEEYLFGKNIAVVEWGDRITESLPLNTLYVDIEVTGENRRKISWNRGNL